MLTLRGKELLCSILEYEVGLAMCYVNDHCLSW